MVRECESCHYLQAIVRYKGQWVCRRCLYPDQEVGFARSRFITLSGNQHHHPDSYMPAEINDIEELKRPLNAAIEKHGITNEYTMQSILVQPS